MLRADRRKFLRTGGMIAIGAGLIAGMKKNANAQKAEPSHPVIARARNAAPISKAERNARIEKAQRIMRDQGIAATLIEPGSSLIYFTGVHWWLSERLTAAIIPAEGEIFFVTPGFEESRLREVMKVPGEVRTWEEHEDPFALVAQWMKEKRIHSKKIAIDEAVRHFIVDGINREAPRAKLVTARDVVNGCRLIKSPAELELMQIASDVTIAAYRDVYPRIEKGMGREDIQNLMYQTQAKFGGSGPSGGAQVGKGSALPHGSTIPEYVEDGSVILLDFGCNIHGYRSDISRTFVFGEPNTEQIRVWNQVRRGQDIAFEMAQVGTPAGEVDKAVRRYYESLGYGPGYQLPGLSHRTGHGIGLDVHEPINFVSNETMPLAPGMCLSNEPGIYMPGKYGVRIEDCIYMTEAGPKWFSTPPASIHRPFD
ncbi:M24 family metallopeptidase [Hyphococcus sp. DH-69]|uniref:M24 family metallopeptidase n=1 Tax=Hyphococcus formosus TaxID=3143534 RepID=UPI00398B493C